MKRKKTFSLNSMIFFLIVSNVFEVPFQCEKFLENNYEVLILAAHKTRASKTFLEGTDKGRKFAESFISLMNKFSSFCYEGMKFTNMSSCIVERIYILVTMNRPTRSNQGFFHSK